MKRICLIVSLFTSLVSYSQNGLYDTIHMTIAPNINQQNHLNQQIIATLKLFLNSKDSSYIENKYWSESDFEKYSAPYGDLEGVDAGRLGKHYYQPSLMEIIETDNADTKIVKVSFIGHPFFNEGFATYVEGSGKYDYKWQKNKLLNEQK